MFPTSRLCIAGLLSLVPVSVWADDVLLRIDNPPGDGLVVAHVDLTAAQQAAGLPVPGSLRALAAVSGDASTPRSIPFQFVPDHDTGDRTVGTVLLRVPEQFDGTVELVPIEDTARVEDSDWGGAVSTDFYTVRHDAGRMGGMPWSMTFAGTGTTFDSFRWNDRLHNPDAGSFVLAGDAGAQAERISQGPLATVIRTRARYVQGDKLSPSEPQAVYDWFYLHDHPLVFVRGRTSQASKHPWREIHFLELNYPQEAMPHWAGGQPLRTGTFSGSRDSLRFSGWGAVHDGRNVVGMLQCGQALLYDGGAGTYLHARGDTAWQGFEATHREMSAWIYINAVDDVATAVQRTGRALPTTAQATVTTGHVQEAIRTLREELAGLPAKDRQAAWWRLAGAEQLEAAGRFDESLSVAGGRRPDRWTILSAGALGLSVEQTDDGLRVVDLFDAEEDRHLLASTPLPLFSLSLRKLASEQAIQLDADHGWGSIDVSTGAEGEVRFRWGDPTDQALEGLCVLVRAKPAPSTNAIHWGLSVDGVPSGWTMWNAVFPQLHVADLGSGARVLFPRGPGEVQQDVWQRDFRFSGTYPSGWTSMQFLAAYDAPGRTGLYVGTHDPRASTKEMLAESRPSDDAVLFAWEHPAPGMGTPQNDYQLPGEVVWQLFRGDWFDAAVIYRDWVRREARWYPELGPDGRPDTPLWMRKLPAWGLGGGGAKSVVPQVKQFAEFLGLPVGFHWYSWHQIPFDNDYPHYFPTVEGFTEAVAELQQNSVHVMPYINGRLWDTRDKGLEDYQFSHIARPAATQDPDGEPYTEMYGSKESDESRVRLAVMCPATDIWQEKVKEIVMRLFSECRVHAVYIDQVAAARPMLCFDPDHGHPMGGGSWWTESYWRLLDRIHQAMPEDRMLTTECNAEPYTHVFDGYLTWHWQHDGQVPAFPAVYGGAIQMFGRAYRGGDTKDLAFKMKAGQQLVFGEQIGWCNPSVVGEEENAAFLRHVVRLRWVLGRYFYAGEMARPPKLLGDIPTVTADWQWSGYWPVTTDAVLSGAWQLPREQRVVLLFVNVSEQPVRAMVAFDAGAYALPKGDLHAVRVTADGRGEPFMLPRTFQRELEFPPQAAWAWEVSQ
jgi:hypothetical protein